MEHSHEQTGTCTVPREQPTEQTEIRTVTQITPDDILAEQGPIRPERKDKPVPEEKVEEDVVAINPSIESMESRG